MNAFNLALCWVTERIVYHSEKFDTAFNTVVNTTSDHGTRMLMLRKKEWLRYEAALELERRSLSS